MAFCSAPIPNTASETLLLPGQKLFPVKLPNCGMNLVFALAGSVPEGSSAIQTLRYALHSKSESMKMKRNCGSFSGRILRSLYRQSIYSNPTYATKKEPDFSLIIIAAWFGRTPKTLSLLRTDRQNPNVVKDYCLSGSGEYVTGSFVVRAPESVSRAQNSSVAGNDSAGFAHALPSQKVCK